jgi:hypothetical protein
LAQRGNSCVNIIYENVFKDKVAKLALWSSLCLQFWPLHYMMPTSV